MYPLLLREPTQPMPSDQAIPGDVAAIVDPQNLTVQDTLFVVERREGETHE